MGIHTYTDVVPFVAHNVFEGTDLDLPDDKDLQILMNVDCYMASEFDWQEAPAEDEDPKLAPPIVKGWQYHDEITKIGKRGNIYAGKWTKDKYTVYLVNEDPYSNGGGISLAVVADNADSILEFCKDFDFEAMIEEEDAIQWIC